MDIWIVLLSGLAVSLLLSRYWHAQAVIDKHLHSIGLLSLAFLTGAVCSSTGVVFTPYLATLPKSYTSAHVRKAGRRERRKWRQELYKFLYSPPPPVHSFHHTLSVKYRQQVRV